MNNYLISVVGPTAIGKTSVAIKLAQYFNTEIISADSRQFYKEMNIGTAIPTIEELNLVKHHFIQHKSIHEAYNVGAFENDALTRLKILFKTTNVVIMVGGSGLYLDAVTDGLDYFPEIDSRFRQQLNTFYKNQGLEPLQEQLKTLDPKTYNTIALNNPHRVIRALEVCLATKNTYSSFLNKKKLDRNFKIITVGLTAERTIIYDRINNRVDHMIAKGLLDEAKKLYNKKDFNALNTVGYKEMFHYLDGRWDLDIAIAEIKKKTRHFAKRQLTWFRKNKKIIWFNYQTPLNDITTILKQNMLP